MTKQEIIKQLCYSKIYVGADSANVQNKLFSLGFYWKSNKADKNPRYLNKPFLYLLEDKTLYAGSDLIEFLHCSFKEVYPDTITSLSWEEDSKTFVDGDIIHITLDSSSYVGIYKKESGQDIEVYAYYSEPTGELQVPKALVTMPKMNIRLAEESEVNAFLKVLSDKHYIWYNNQLQSTNFKPFDKVLVSDNEKDWKCALFYNYSNDENMKFGTSAGYYSKCIAYELNKNLYELYQKPED